MTAYRRVDGFKSPAGWLPVPRDQLRVQHSVTSMGSLYPFFYIHKHRCNAGVVWAWMSTSLHGSSAQCPVPSLAWLTPAAACHVTILFSAGSRRSEDNVGVILRQSWQCDLTPKTIGDGIEGQHVSTTPYCHRRSQRGPAGPSPQSCQSKKV